MYSVDDLSTESKLSVILKKRPKLIEQLALCLDREMRFIPNWRHLARNLDVDVNVIKRLGQYCDHSPTIRLFEFLEVTQPDLTIKQLKDALLEIRSNDLFSLLSSKAAFADTEKVVDVITSPSYEARSPTAGLLDEIALALDGTSLALSNWYTLALKLGVPRDICWVFERRLTENPTGRMFQYLAITCPHKTLLSLKEALKSIERKELVEYFNREKLRDDMLLRDIITPGSELLERLALELNQEENSRLKNWIHLAWKMEIPADVRRAFADVKQIRKSPTKEILEWVAAQSPEIALSDVAEALHEIQRNDAIQIISKYSPGYQVVQVFTTTVTIKEGSSCSINLSYEKDIAPYYVLARGEKAMAAYQRALEEGEIIDRRVKVMLIGQDRAGKTNVGHALKGEKFNPKESSTDGVQMHEVLKDVGVQPWKNSILTKETTTYHHKCAELICRDLLTGINQESMTTPNETSTLEQDLPEHPQLNSSPEMEGLKLETFSVPKEKFDGVKQIEPSPNHTSREFEGEASWENIAGIVDGKLQGKDSDGEEGIWPIIWDFAGQAVYRAIHPIFMSSEAIYLLVVNLSKNLFATAQCRVKENGREEVTIPAPDYNDTNFDHIMRWLDLVHSLRRSRQLPPVILVGTHVDLVVNPEQKLYDLKSTLCHNSKVLSDHIAIALNVDNTKAGTISPQGEDTGITKLREKVIKTADKLQQTKRKVPLKWLQVEDRVYNMAKKGTMYTKREQLRLKIVDEIGPLEKEDDYEHLLNFLHDRGTIVYHVQAEDPNGLIVLDPRWLIEVLCKIVSVKTHEDEELSLFSLCQDLKGKGILHGELLDHALSAQKLSHIRESLLFTMEKFNLLCRFNDKDDKPAFLVPCMLTITPEEDLIRTEGEGYAPAYIIFNTDYVPAGLFCRILVLLGKWAASKTSCDQQQFYSNAARFIIEDLTCLGLVCHKSVIKVHIWSMDSSNPVKRNPTLCEEAFRSLEGNLTILKKECYWMRAVSWKFSGKCNLCLGKVDPKTKNCSRHDKKGCDSDDCAHYVAINSHPFCCENAKVLDQRLQRTWIQALPSKGANSVSTTHINMGEALDSKRSRSINSHSFPSSSHCRGSDCALNVTLLAVEWGSSKGGFSTINRNLAINFAKHKRLNVTLFVPKGSCSDEEKKAARRHNVAVREASSPDGYEDGDWLTNPADDFAIDFVFGHGINLGKQAKRKKRTHKCKWVQVVHTAPEDLGMQRKGTDAISKGIKENEIVVNLCRSADVVVTVGPKLKEHYDSSLCFYKKDHDIIQLTPGIFSEFSDVKRVSHKRSEFSVLVYGLIDPEDFSLKGYDLAAKAMAELKNDNYRLLVVGAPEEKLEQIADTFEDCGISRAKLTVKSIVKDRERLVALFCQADLLLMPSRTEAFGLTALEALSAGLPVLVSENSGFGQVLSTLPSGDQFVVKSNDPCEWARQIANVRRKDTEVRLDEVKALQKYYDASYSWERECSKLDAKMWNIFRDPVSNTLKDDTGNTIENELDSQMPLLRTIAGSKGYEISANEDPVSNTLKDDAGKTIENELDSQMLLLQKIARSKGYKISDNEGSGNCMFHALSEQLSRIKRITMSSYELRQAIVHYLRKNPGQPDGTCWSNFVEGWKSWDDYLQHMEQDGSWGDHLILLATANLFKTCIRVVRSLSHHDDVFIMSNYCTDDRNPLVLGHVPELHYVSLVRRDANPSE